MADLSLNDARWQLLAVLRAAPRDGHEELNTRHLHRLLSLDLGHPMEFARFLGPELLGYLEGQGYIAVRRVPSLGQSFVKISPLGIQVLEGARRDPGIGVWAERAG